jgi:hypothetical protein
MNLDEVEAAVQHIEAIKDDDEMAHSAEDDLYEQVLRHHAALGCPLAAAALKTRKIRFARWCA